MKPNARPAFLTWNVRATFVRRALVSAALLALALAPGAEPVCHAKPRVMAGRSAFHAGFAFRDVPPPASNDAAGEAKFLLVDGERDPAGGDLDVLRDGRVPADEDQPARNFFFRAGADGGRIRIDLGRVVAVSAVHSYSWHPGSRAPQVYTLYGADGTAAGFQPDPKRGADPIKAGWMLLASVDTRAAKDDGERDGDGDGAEGGQHGVAVRDDKAILGRFRHLLLDIARTDDRDRFSNTFYSEIDVLEDGGPAPVSTVAKPVLRTFDAADGKYRFTVDATAAPDLAEWSEKTLGPIVRAWYPKIVALLPDEGYEAPREIVFRFRDDLKSTPAYAVGARVSLNAGWFRRQLKGEAAGAVVHELVHVVQEYQGRPADPKAAATPGWIVEGLADYVRWFQYEPESQRAEITQANLAEAKHDASYRVSANFLDWVARTHGMDVVPKLNSAARSGRYREPLWKDWTGRTLTELADDWKRYHAKRLSGAE